MKKIQLKRKLAIAKTALELYRGYKIDGRLYADAALNDMDIIDNEKFYSDDRLRKEITNDILNILKKELQS